MNEPAGALARDSEGLLPELIALLKRERGKYNFASSGAGTSIHMAGELFKLATGTDITHVPSRGAAPAVNDRPGQQVQRAFLDLPVLLPHITAGAAMTRPN